MEDSEVLNVDNHLHSFALHYVFTPRIARDLEDFRNAHNNHRVRTENHQTPLQMWLSSAIENMDTTISAIRNISDNPESLQTELNDSQITSTSNDAGF